MGAMLSPGPAYDVNLLDGYPIRITDEQAITLLGPAHAKRTLTWSDTCRHSGLHFRTLVAAGVPVDKLHIMQPDIVEWVRMRKADVHDCTRMELWTPDPLMHFGYKLADLAALQRGTVTPDVLAKAGHTVQSLMDQHDLSPELMSMLNYSVHEWLGLGLQPKHVAAIPERQWHTIFGKARREDVLALATRCSAQPPPPSKAEK